MARIASTFPGSGCTPSVLSNIQKNVITLSLTTHLSRLKTSPCSRSKGFYQQILVAVTVLKFLQKLALDFHNICQQFFPGNFYRQMYKKF